MLLLAGSLRATGQAAGGQKPDVLQRTADPAMAPAEKPNDPNAGEITEDEIRQLLVGKTLYLRKGYLDGSLQFDEHGRLMGNSPEGSFTLCLVEIDKVHLSKRKLELTGSRFGLHFLGALPNEDPTKAVDRVRITPKKKVLKITIDRELVVIPKKKKERKDTEKATAMGAPLTSAEPAADAAGGPPSAENDVTTAKPPVETPGPVGTVTTTTSPAHSARLMREALDAAFSQGLDDRLIASLPSFWKLYFDAVAHQTDFRPADPSIYRQSTVDQPAKLLTRLEPPSNEFAQANGVAGMALYHTIVGADGKAEQIVVARPIGFGLDESAADTIRKAAFQPAIKGGKAVPVMVDLVVEFRIYSNRTSQASPPEQNAGSNPILPGPYTAAHQ
ncbi:MAG: energy transducer TonB [Terracidiphilus sp.]